MTLEWLEGFRKYAVVEINDIASNLPTGLSERLNEVALSNLNASIEKSKMVDKLLENGLLTDFNDQAYEEYKNG